MEVIKSVKKTPKESPKMPLKEVKKVTADPAKESTDKEGTPKDSEVAGKKTTPNLTYEQLCEVCNQLFQQVQQLEKQVQELDITRACRILDYMFKVVELSGKIKDAEFVGFCADRIKEALYSPKDENTKEEGKKE